MSRTYGDCRDCGSPITTPRAKRCDNCRTAHPDRHTTRRKGQMFVSVDGEGVQTGDRMRLVTLSYGREDGSSETWSGDHAADALLWLQRRITRDYVDAEGTTWRQVPVAFHFNWDASTISTYFDPHDMLLVHKAIARETNLLCDTEHRPGDDPCDKAYHRRLISDIDAVITDGGEGDVLAWDAGSKLAITATPRRRFYYEYRPRGDQFQDRGAIVDIHDTGSAFVGGLLGAISSWKPELTPEQQAIIEWGKTHRKDGTFAHGDVEKVAAYSEAECVAHARMCRQLITAVRDVAHFDMKPSKLFGSGSVASAAFTHHGVPARDESHSSDEQAGGVGIDDVAWLTYFGGLIETPVVGLVAGHVDELDLNSAYPAQMIHLPCMRAGHGQWRKARGHRELPDHTVGHVLASWVVDTPSTPPFLVRDADSCVYAPLTGQKIWTTLPEYQAGIRQFPRDITAHHTVWWEQDCECEPPLLWIGELYQERLKLKRQLSEHPKGSAEWQHLKCLETAIKLVINSCYGKLAQRRPTMGQFTNLHYAAMITGATRASVRKETWKRESETAAGGREAGIPVYQHTDSVLSIGGNPVNGGDTLGAWGLEDKPTRDFVIVQPGLAAAPTGKAATRGVREEDFVVAVSQWRELVDFTTHPTTWPPIKIEQKRMYSRRLAIAQGHPERAGAFLPSPLSLSVGDTHKRNIAAAYQVSTRAPRPGEPDRRTMWIVPPIDYVTAPVRVPEDIKAYQKLLAERERAGEFDGELSTALMAGAWDGEPSEFSDPEWDEPSELVDAEDL